MRRHCPCVAFALVTLLSPRVTPFQGRNTLDAGLQRGGDWHAPVAHPAREMLDMLWRIMATRDVPTAGHAVRVQGLCVAVAHEIGPLTSHRPYRQPLEHAEAIAMILARRRTMYDPGILDAFVRILQRVRTSEPNATRDFSGGYPRQLQSMRVI